MNFHTLQEYAEKEQEQSNLLYYQNLDRLQNSSDETLSYLDFFPELKLKLENKAYTNWMIDSKSIFVQLPFYDTLILPLKPFPNESAFKKMYGIDVDQTIELTKKGKVIPLLAHAPTNYINLDYMNKLLELKNPSIGFRMGRYNTCRLVGVLEKPYEQLMNWVQEGEQLARKLDLTSANHFHNLTNNTVSHNARGNSGSAETMAMNYAHLNLMGYSELASQLIDFPDSELVYIELSILENLLHQIPHWSLDGSQSMLESDCMVAHIWDVPVKSYPVDIGKTLTKEFHLLNIRDVGFEKVIDITNQTHKARSALLELDKAVENEQSEKIIDRAESLEIVWTDTNDVIQSMMSKKNNISKYFPLFFGLVGSAAGAINMPGIFETIFDNVGNLPVISPLSDKLLKLKKPSHVVAVYDLKNSID